MVDDVKEELDRLIQANVGDGLHLYPLGEFVHCYEQVSEAAWALFEGSYHVEAPMGCTTPDTHARPHGLCP